MKTIGEGILAAFTEVSAAVHTALKLSAAITADGTVSQYAVVCICCSGRSSPPDRVFSLV